MPRERNPHPEADARPRSALARAAASGGVVPVALALWLSILSLGLVRLLDLHWMGFAPFELDEGLRVLPTERAAARPSLLGIEPGWRLEAVDGSPVADLREAKIRLHEGSDPRLLLWRTPEDRRVLLAWSAGLDARLPRIGEDLRPDETSGKLAALGLEDAPRATFLNGFPADQPGVAEREARSRRPLRVQRYGASSEPAAGGATPDPIERIVAAMKIERELPVALLSVGFLMGVLGVALWRLHPESRSARAFAVFCLYLGATYAVRSIPAAYRTSLERSLLVHLMCFQLLPGIHLLGAFSPLRGSARRARTWLVAAAAFGLVLEAAYWLRDSMWLFMVLWSAAGLALLATAWFSNRLAPAGGPSSLDAQRAALVRRAMACSFAPVGLFTLASMFSLELVGRSRAPIELTVLAFPAIVAYGIVRRNLLDVHEFRVEGFAYGGLAAAAVAAYVGLAALATPLLDERLPGAGLGAQGLLAALVASGTYPALRRVQRSLEARFDRREGRYEEFVGELRVARVEERPPETFFELVSSRLPRLAEVSEVRLETADRGDASGAFVPGDLADSIRDLPEGVSREDLQDRAGAGADEERILRFLEARAVAWIFPLLVERRLLGCMVVGEKIGGRNFTRAEVERIRQVVRECTLALYARTIQERTREKMIAESALAETREKFRLFSENALDVIFRLRVRPEPLVEYMSPSIERVSGLRPEAFYDDPGLLFEIVDPDDRPSLVERMAPGGGSERLHEVRWSGPDGSIRWMEQRLAPVFEDGELVAFEGLARDVSDRKKSEQEREALEAQLRQSQKLEALGTLAGGIAHDFGNSLVAVASLVQRARAELPEDSPAREALEDAAAAAEQARGVSRGLLTLARRSPPERRAMDLARVARESLRILRRLLPASIRFEERLPEGGLRILADESQIRQVLMNLVLNARDAMPDGGRILVEVFDEAVENNGGGPARGAVLVVEDDGRGMSPELIARAFDPFFTTRGEGTGLGLAISHGIVVDHGGRIDVESREGRGTRFAIRLPALAGGDDPADATAAKAGGPADASREDSAAPALEGRGRSILVAEDHPLVLATLSGRLRALGFEVAATGDGADAMTRLEARDRAAPFDLLVLDLDLPGMDGPAILRRLRERADRTPVLVITGRPNFDASEFPGVATLGKPFAMHALDRAVTDALRRERTP